jgi:cell division protein ZipA
VVEELRWVLLLAAVAVLVAVFVWTRYRKRFSEALRISLLQPSTRSVQIEPGPDASDTPGVISSPPVCLPEKIVTIRLLCRDKHGFPGDDLVLALRDNGLRHGRFGIFHHHAPGAVEVDPGVEPVFSVASLTEPGSFDLTRVRGDRFPGVSLFMGLPGPVDGVAAFDQMVATARAIATRLSGDLVDEQGSTLSVQRERYLREEVIQFQLRQGRG